MQLLRLKGELRKTVASSSDPAMRLASGLQSTFSNLSVRLNAGTCSELDGDLIWQAVMEGMEALLCGEVESAAAQLQMLRRMEGSVDKLVKVVQPQVQMQDSLRAVGVQGRA